MSQIRRQSILSTLFVYGGLCVGFVNTFLFTRQGSPFSPSEYAITVIFLAVANLMFAFSNFGVVSVVYKFYPYYNDNLPKKKNDLLTWSLLICLVGFVIVLLAGIIFKDLVVRKFGGNSPLFLRYYRWIFPFGLGLLLFTLLEAFGWNIRKPVFTTFLREVFFKLITFILIFLLSFEVIRTFDLFVEFYAFTYLVTTLVLLGFLIRHGEFHMVAKVSRVTKKFYKKMAAMAGFAYTSGLVLMIGQFIDMLIIMSLLGTEAAGIFSLGFVVSGLVQAPQRGAVSAATPVLAKAWKDKDIANISGIYHRSSINLLITSLGIFFLIWLSYGDAVTTFKLKPAYMDSLWIFFYFGLARVVDLGTGLNSQIITTSTFWRFEFISGIVLLVIIVPLDYLLIKEYGIIGAGYANLISFSVYNILRVIFLKRKFNLQPFSRKTLLALLLGTATYFICYFAFGSFDNLTGIILRSALFVLVFGGGVYFLKLTPDAMPVMRSLIKKLAGKRSGDEMEE